MPKLKCKAENCAFNYDWLCRKNSVDIDGMSSKCKVDTCCSSFAEGNDSRIFAEFASFEETPKLQKEVYCDAINCVYERNQKCCADKIEITNNNATTFCSTFEPCE